MTEDKSDGRSRNVLVRSMRSTVGRESTTFGFSILVTAAFGLLQSVQGTPGRWQIFLYAGGAVMSFTLLEGVLSRGFRRSMPQHRTETMALGTSLNLISVGAGLLVALMVAHAFDGYLAWGLAPYCAGTAYLLVESGEAAVAERLLRRSGHQEAAEVTD